MTHRHAHAATAHPQQAGARATPRAPPRQDAVADTARACAATALVSLYRPGEDAAALREGAAYSVAGLLPKDKPAGRRGLALMASAGSAWRAVDDLGDRCARGGGGVEGRPRVYATAQGDLGSAWHRMVMRRAAVERVSAYNFRAVKLCWRAGASIRVG